MKPVIVFNHIDGIVQRVDDVTSVPLRFHPPGCICPDVFGSGLLGEADTLRGRVVRGFMRLMDHWPKP